MARRSSDVGSDVVQRLVQGSKTGGSPGMKDGENGSSDPAESMLLNAKRAKDYLMANVAPTLSKALTDLCKVSPKDPLRWLGNRLLEESGAVPLRSAKKVFFVLGGPGAGKGTQCAKIVEEFKFDHFSAGDLLRKEASANTPESEMIATILKEGRIVPGHITIGLLRKAIESSTAPGILIDGFPRKLDQAGAFEKDVSDFEFVLFFDCPEEVMETRLLKRGETSGRTDDNSESIKLRFKTFVQTSMPVVDYYGAKGKVHKIDATKSPEDVYATVRELMLPYARKE